MSNGYANTFTMHIHIRSIHIHHAHIDGSRVCFCVHMDEIEVFIHMRFFLVFFWKWNPACEFRHCEKWVFCVYSMHCGAYIEQEKERKQTKGNSFKLTRRQPFIFVLLLFGDDVVVAFFVVSLHYVHCTNTPMNQKVFTVHAHMKRMEKRPSENAVLVFIESTPFFLL